MTIEFKIPNTDVILVSVPHSLRILRQGLAHSYLITSARILYNDKVIVKDLVNSINNRSPYHITIAKSTLYKIPEGENKVYKAIRARIDSSKLTEEQLYIDLLGQIGTVKFLIQVGAHNCIFTDYEIIDNTTKQNDKIQNQIF